MEEVTINFIKAVSTIVFFIFDLLYIRLSLIIVVLSLPACPDDPGIPGIVENYLNFYLCLKNDSGKGLV